MGASAQRLRKDLKAGSFQPAINSFTLHLNAEGKSPKTVRTYVEATQWFAAAHLRAKTDWDEVTADDVRNWMVWLLHARYSRLARWLLPRDRPRAAEEGVQDPCVTTELNSLATALYVKADDLLKESPGLAPWRPAVLSPRG